MNANTQRPFAAVGLIVLLVIAACSPATTDQPPITPARPEHTAGPTSIWSDLLRQSPYPYTTPLPPADVTILDGTYVRADPIPSTRIPDNRATPTPPGGGAWMWHPIRPTVWVMPPGPYSIDGSGWTLHLDKGVFRVFHEPTGWRSLGSFTVAGNQIEFFNDPNCMEAIGTYTWKLEAGQLLLQGVVDECGAASAFQSGRGRRLQLLESVPWTKAQ